MSLVELTIWGSIGLVLVSALLSATALTSILFYRAQRQELGAPLETLLLKHERQPITEERLRKWFIHHPEQGELIEIGRYRSPAHPIDGTLRSPPLSSSFPHVNHAYVVRATYWTRPSRVFSALFEPRVIELSVPTLGTGGLRQPRWILRVKLRSPLSELIVTIREQWLILIIQSAVLTCFVIFLINRALVRPIAYLSRFARRLPEVTSDSSERDTAYSNALEYAPQELQNLRVSLEEARDQLIRDRKSLSRMYQRLAEQERSLTSEYVSTQLMHELGNPLASVMGIIEFLKEEPHHQSHDDLLNLAHKELMRVREISRRSMNLSKEDSKALIINDLVNWLLVILKYHEKYSSLEIVTSGHLTAQSPLPLHIAQAAILNLVLNGARAQGGEGSIWIHVQEEQNEDKGQLAIYVSDQGEGVDEAIINRIFEPGWSGDEEGSGLGLSISRSSLERFGGSLLYLDDSSQARLSIQDHFDHSKDYAGACFLILAPLSVCSS